MLLTFKSELRVRTTSPAFLVDVSNDCIPVAISFLLIEGGDVEKECFTVLEGIASIETDAGYATDGEINGQDITCIATGEVARCQEHCVDRAIRKSLGVKGCRFFSVFGVPQANGVLVYGVYPSGFRECSVYSHINININRNALMSITDARVFWS